jgi:ABC-type uncharacterized transport system auxiliary subunit
MSNKVFIANVQSFSEHTLHFFVIKSWTTKTKDKTRIATAFEIRFMRLLAKYAWTDYKGNNMEKYLKTKLV